MRPSSRERFMDASALVSAESWIYWIGIAKLVAAFLVAAGVAIEFGGDWVVRPYEKVIADSRNAEMTRLATEAETSKAAAADAHARAAEASQKAAEAQLALAKFKAPRTLTPEQEQSIEDALKPFIGQQYALSVAPGIEASNLLCVLDSILKRAGWQQHAAIGSIMVGTDCGPAGLNSLTGIDARRSPTASPATIGAINALVEALAGTDVALRGVTDPVNNPTGEVIILMVGAKP